MGKIIWCEELDVLGSVARYDQAVPNRILSNLQVEIHQIRLLLGEMLSRNLPAAENLGNFGASKFGAVAKIFQKWGAGGAGGGGEFGDVVACG